MQFVKQNEYATEPIAPTRANYEFKYWTEERPDGTTEEFNFTTTPITHDINLTAVWTPKSNSTSDDNNQDEENQDEENQDEESDHSTDDTNNDNQNEDNQMYETVITMSERTTLSLSDDITQEDISIIYRALRYDHPEIYWIQAYKYIVDGNNMYFYPTYLVNTEEKSLYDNQLEDWTDGIIKAVDKDWSDYEKELALYDFLVENTEYNLSAPLNQSLISAVQGESVCLGYTKAFKYLCDKVGLECIVVEGISKDGVGHSWNKVNIDGNWYNVDSTNSTHLINMQTSGAPPVETLTDK